MSLNVAGSRNHGKEKQVQRRIDCWKVEIRFLHGRRHLFRSVSRLNHTLVIAFYNHYTGEQGRQAGTHGGHVETKGKSCAQRSRKGRHALLRRKTKRSYALASFPPILVAARKLSSTVSFSLDPSRVRSLCQLFPITLVRSSATRSNRNDETRDNDIRKLLVISRLFSTLFFPLCY